MGYTQLEVSQANLILRVVPIEETKKGHEAGRPVRVLGWAPGPLCLGSNPGSATQPDVMPVTSPPHASVSPPVKLKR